MSHDLSELQNFQVGVVAAFIEGVILQPTLYWKNAKAQKLPFSMNPKIIYRGTSAAIYNEMQMMGLQFVFTRLFQRINQNSDGTITRMQEVRSAIMGGAMSALFASPVELVMIQQQRFGGSMFHTISKISKEFGISKLTRGVLPAIYRDCFYVSGMLAVTPIVQDILIKDYSLTKTESGLVASLIGGLVAAVPSHPLDVVKTCMQGDLQQVTYSTMTKTFKKLWSEGGIKRMFDGCFWRTFNVVATVYIANECRIHFPPIMFGDSSLSF